MTSPVPPAGEGARGRVPRDDDRRAWLSHLEEVCGDVARSLDEGTDSHRHRQLLVDVNALRDRLRRELDELGREPPGEREARIAQNELLFRQVNDRIDELTGDWEHSIMSAVCECGVPDCFAPIELRLGDYHRVRSARHFVVRPGHEIPDVETIVERRDGYVLVEKPADALRLAEPDERPGDVPG